MRISLLASLNLTYLALQWTNFDSCPFQLNIWLAVVYVLTIAARISLWLVRRRNHYAKTTALLFSLTVCLPFSLCMVGAAWMGMNRMHSGASCVRAR